MKRSSPRDRPRRGRARARTWLPGLLLISPSLIAVAVFVYGMIGYNLKVSVSKWHSSVKDTSYEGFKTYRDLMDDERFTQAWQNLLTFTVVFIVGTLVMGLVMALLLEKGARGEGFFRSVYLFPMAISFIASGIVWRWLMNPAPGDRASGLNVLFGRIGLDGLQNQWWQDPDWGMAAMAMPAIWQMSGYVMALFLAGFRGIPEELREAARVDGAGEFQVYRHVVFPQLRPVALSALIIVGHISLKVFDLIVAVAGQQIIADVPAIYMWQAVFQGYDYAKGAAIATCLLLFVAVLVVPYLVHTFRQEKR
ncbi:carbohydrate ABC transporter permease [Wenjunlia tyrosinilytica]|uniref:Sugar ABC transporter permease n=1 Tax=Wenjunlia tyrosinilytica TaxID=1544741 RepID=A0A917ZY25_9ACTN|nr:sugar ABC transporter permease [Wenjunlia tyrosinilytica]GGO99968.1 sugar ABC transporter permease [Wenjunlia tyrosinilytica]